VQALTNRKKFALFIKDKGLKKGEQSAFRGCKSTCLVKKRVTIILMNYKDEMRSKVNKANNEKTKPIVVYDYNQNMGAFHLRD
jgi:hypothetical protein